ncbi:hypothetical protein OROGR_029952 [Orobanche gracilis]
MRNCDWPSPPSNLVCYGNIDVFVTSASFLVVPCLDCTTAATFLLSGLSYSVA